MGAATWAKVFETGEIGYPNTEDGKSVALADSLSAWGNCFAGIKPPEKFGEGMVAIGKFLDVDPTPEALSTRANKILDILT